MSKIDSTSPAFGADDISGRTIEDASGRIIPRQMVSGSTRGTQIVGYGKTKIDGSKNVITVGSDDGTVGMGTLPVEVGTGNGFFGQDSSGNLLYTVDGSTWVWRDVNTGKPRMQIKSVGGDFSFKISQNNIDVTEAEDDELVFNSDSNLFKIVKTGTATLPSAAAPSAGSSTTQQVNIDTLILSTAPLTAWAFLEESSGSRTPLPTIFTMASAGFGGYVANIYTFATSVNADDTVRISFAVRNFENAATPIQTIRYYIARETASS